MLDAPPGSQHLARNLFLQPKQTGFDGSLRKYYPSGFELILFIYRTIKLPQTGFVMINSSKYKLNIHLKLIMLLQLSNARPTLD